MYSTTQKYLYKINKISFQSKVWYKLSVFVVFSIIFLIYSYDYIVLNHLDRWFIGAGLITSAIWWYWTMNVLSTLLKLKDLQLTLLDEILEGIKEVKITTKGR